MKKINKTVLLFLIMLLLTSCNEIFPTIYFNLKNNSNKSIYNGVSHLYPDTSLKNLKRNEIFIISPDRVYPHRLDNFADNPTLQIFIFDANVIDNNPWDTIVKYNMYLKRYQFTRSELDKMNLEIVYDGN